MIAYIKRMSDYALLAALEVIDPKLAWGEDGSITAILPDGGDVITVYGFTNNWIICNGEIRIVKAASIDKTTITLTTEDPYYLFSIVPMGFDDAKQYCEASTKEWGAIFCYALRKMTKQIRSSYYPIDRAMSYITFSATGTIERTYTYKIDGDYFIDDADELLAAAIADGVKFNFTLTTTGINIEITSADVATHKIIFDGVNNILLSEDYSVSGITEICVYYVNSDNFYVSTVMYLGTDGKYHTDKYYKYTDDETAPSESGDTWTNAAPGRWICISRPTKKKSKKFTSYEYLQNLCQEYADDYSEDYVIEIKSKTQYEVGDYLVMNLHGNEYESQITSISKEKDSEYYNITCGNLANTVRKKLSSLADMMG